MSDADIILKITGILERTAKLLAEHEARIRVLEAKAEKPDA